MMNEIIAQNELTMSSREIAELTGKRHTDVKRDIIKMIFDLGEDVSIFARNYFDQMNRRQEEVVLDKEHTECLLTGYSAKLRMIVIKRWQELENKTPAIPQNLGDALRLAADQADQIALMAPKAEFADKVIASDHTYSLSEAGKKIKQRPRKLIEWLTDSNFISLKNKPYQQYINQGLFEVSTGIKNEHEYTQTRVTLKGCAYFSNKLTGVKL